MTYFTFEIFALIVPSIILWIFAYRILSRFIIPILFVVLINQIFLIVEHFAINYWDIWFYPAEKITGIYYWQVPLEEYIYLIFSPFIAASVICLIYQKLNKDGVKI